ncbi:hypothetical protein [Deinococcus roseus]|uniref:TMhelix containing protein n=1 Tax=Deinococcus roseus TaxID=392414 RepID=A0ABQ2DGK2_9DEIO|nr:hypothetical protein [Deinococcus roseus]GGJ56588.1 hypothetical protein GCM10008938_48440 [Deinococcus roseus]
MDLLGALIGIVPTVAKGLFPDQTAIAQANAQASAAQAAAQAQIEHDKIQAKANEKYVMYGLIGVGVLAAGLVAFKLVQD